MISTEKLTEKFQSLYNSQPQFVFRAPGRVNLIGEHTDYNGGFVFPAAINCEIKMAMSPRNDSLIHLYSMNFNQKFTIDANAKLVCAEKPYTWANYFIAVVDQFQKRGVAIPGMNVVLNGDVPLGAGLSSSAAYEVCVAVMLDTICNTKIAKPQIALLSQAAEHSPFVGVRCGIMDQFISALGQADHALLIDCHSLDYQLIPFDSARASIVIINSMKRRGLMDSEYNTRRSECEQGLALIRRLSGEPYETIRHIPMKIFEKYQDKLSDGMRARVRHNLTENARVHALAEALKANDWTAAGKALYTSHASLRDDFGVSCAELDAIVEIAQTIDGVYGCRMTGAGFGGCAVALVNPDAVAQFEKTMTQEYFLRTGLECAIYNSTPCNGAGMEK